MIDDEFIWHKKAIYSRRITDEHRLVYDVKDDRPRILSCKAHYEKKNFDEYWKQKISVKIYTDFFVT